MAKYEIEHRGRLSKKQKAELEAILKKNGKLIKKYERTQWIFGLSHKKTIDFRIKQTNGENEFSLKVGRLNDSNRKEISIPFGEDKLEESFEFAKYMGHSEGLIAIRNASIYLYKGVEWAIVEVPSHSYYFEAEKLVENKKDGKKALTEIEKIASELGLKIFTPEETLAYIRLLDKEANEEFKL